MNFMRRGNDGQSCGQLKKNVIFLVVFRCSEKRNNRFYSHPPALGPSEGLKIFEAKHKEKVM